MKKIILLNFLFVTLIHTQASATCDSQTLEKSLVELCTTLSSLEYDAISNVDTLADAKLKLNNCDGSYAFVYSPIPPYELIRFPFRSYDNKVFKIQDRSNFIQKLTESSIKNKQVSSVSNDYGPTDLGLKKVYIASSCQMKTSSQQIMLATSFLTTSDKKFLSPNLFSAPSFATEKSLYSVVANPALAAADRARAMTMLYEKSVALSQKDLLTHLDLSEDIIDSVLLNSFHKEKIVEFVIPKMHQNISQNVNDIKGALEAYLEKSLFANTNLALLIKLHNEKKAISVESAKLSGELKNATEELKVVKEKLHEVTPNQLILWENNNYTYAVVTSVIFMLISMALGVVLYRK